MDFCVKSRVKRWRKHGKEQWKLDERILIQSTKSITDYFLKEQYM